MKLDFIKFAGNYVAPSPIEYVASWSIPPRPRGWPRSVGVGMSGRGTSLNHRTLLAVHLKPPRRREVLLACADDASNLQHFPRWQVPFLVCCIDGAQYDRLR